MRNRVVANKQLTPQTLVQGRVKLASLPQIFYRMDEAINNPYSQLSEIADIILEDSNLSARLLKIVNSAMYSTPSEITTITRAITIIGTKQLRDLVLATIVIKQFQGISSDWVTMESFWKHSIACGLAARIIATYSRKSNVEHFYLLGLLHDIGRLVLLLELSDMTNSAIEHARGKGELLYRVEQEQIGFDHSQVGGALLKKWKLPESLEEPVLFHHDPLNANHYPDETAILHVADIVANSLRFGSSGECFVPPLNNEAWGRIGLSVSTLGAIVVQIDQQYQDAIHLFLGDTANG